jgi:hypothetical protein
MKIWCFSYFCPPIVLLLSKEFSQFFSKILDFCQVIIPYFYHSFNFCYLEFKCKKELFFVMYWFIYSLIYLLILLCMVHFNFILWVIIHCSLYYFVLSTVLDLTMTCPFKLVLFFLTNADNFFCKKSSLLTGITRCFSSLVQPLTQ